MRSIGLILIIGLLSGCARYEYEITRPVELAQHIGAKTDAIVAREPLEYRLLTVDSRLVIRIFNPTDTPMTLLGPRSSVVDPKGQSHPLQTQTMAPRSFVKLILPPLRPRIERGGPSIGIGFGTMIGSTRRRPYPYGWDTYDDEPRYLTVYDDDNALYWNWDGEADVRVMFVYQQGERIFEHEFVFARKKM